MSQAKLKIILQNWHIIFKAVNWDCAKGSYRKIRTLHTVPVAGSYDTENFFSLLFVLLVNNAYCIGKEKDFR